MDTNVMLTCVDVLNLMSESDLAPLEFSQHVRNHLDFLGMRKVLQERVFSMEFQYFTQEFVA